MERDIRPESGSGLGVSEGVVVENRGAQFDVNVEGVTVRCLLRGRLKKGKQRQGAPVAAGDRVRVTLLEPGRGVIDFRAVLAALRDVGYDGWVTVELYPYESQAREVAEEAMRALAKWF